MSLLTNRPHSRSNRRPELAKLPLRRMALLLALAVALVGCGSQPDNAVNPQTSYATSYQSPYFEGNSSPYPTGPGYGEDWTADPNSHPFPAYPTESTASPQIPGGVDVQLVSKDRSGILNWERCEAQITVSNHAATPQQGYLIASFTLKGREVELQYRVLSLPAKGNQTFRMKSTVKADDVRLEYREKLL